VWELDSDERLAFGDHAFHGTGFEPICQDREISGFPYFVVELVP
jgi:hypothetical protein